QIKLRAIFFVSHLWIKFQVTTGKNRPRNCVHFALGAQFKELQLNRVCSFELAGTKRQQRPSVAITKERDFKFLLSAVTSAIHVAVLFIDVVLRLGIARKIIVASHHSQPSRQRRFEILRGQEEKIINDRHLLLFALANDWPVVLPESECNF